MVHINSSTLLHKHITYHCCLTIVQNIHNKFNFEPQDYTITIKQKHRQWKIQELVDAFCMNVTGMVYGQDVNMKEHILYII